MRVLTSSQSSDVSIVQDGHLNLSIDGTPRGTQADFDGVTLMNQAEIEHVDSELAHLPKSLYVEKLLYLCRDDEDLICWYRNVLCSRARDMEGCPTGNLVNRKNTKLSSSREKYARDCYALYLFTQGDTSCIEEVFYKSKTNTSVPDVTKVTTVELRALVQSLAQRVTTLEGQQREKDRTIDLLQGQILSLSDTVTRLNAKVSEAVSSSSQRLANSAADHSRGNMSYADILTTPSSTSLTKNCSKVNGPSASITARSSGPRNASTIRSSSKPSQPRASVRDGINTDDTGREDDASKELHGRWPRLKPGRLLIRMTVCIPLN